MLTHRQVQKQLLDRFNQGDLSGHLLARELSKTYFFSWATASGEMDLTHLAKDAKHLWFFQFQLAARVLPCKTSITVACPARYRLRVGGQKRASQSVNLQIFPGDEFSERIGYEIVDEEEPIECPARYQYDGQASVGSERLSIAAALDLV